MTRKELRDTMDKREAFITKIGQKEATRYLRTKEGPPTQGNIRAGIALVVLTIAILVVVMAL